jgi:hypothetical protein
MRVVAGVLWTTLLVAAPEPGLVVPSSEGCVDALVSMGQSVEIGTNEMMVPQCTKDDRDCFLGLFFCSDVKVFRPAIAFAECTLDSSDHSAHSLGFTVESASEAVTFIPPFSGRLTCGPLDPEDITDQYDPRVLRDAAETDGYSCQGTPRPQNLPTTTARCKTKP